MRPDCSKCRRPIPPDTGDALGGLCFECISGFVLETDPPEGEPLPLEVGAFFQGFQILELIARGGMGVVYKARQLDLDRLVALKVLSPSLAGDPDFARRFNVEAKVLARLSHPSIVQVFDFGRSGALYYLVMEYVEGGSLRDLLRRGPLDGAHRARLLSQICGALDHAHQHDVIHRDIKPENILVDRQGRVKITDFGLAKLVRPDPKQGSATQVDLVMGTPKYMAPEQSESLATVDHRA